MTFDKGCRVFVTSQDSPDGAAPATPEGDLCNYPQVVCCDVNVDPAGCPLSFRTPKGTNTSHVALHNRWGSQVNEYKAIFIKLFSAHKKNIKPIFHQNAKYLALGTFASPNAKDSTSASPNARNTNMLVSLALGDASFLRWPCTFLFFLCRFLRVG